MFREGETNNSEQEPLKIIQELPVDDREFHIELFKEEKVDVALEKQDAQLNFRERNCDKNTLSGLRKWLGVATVLGASLLAIGCNAEKSSSGFIDNEHQNVQQRLENQKKQIEHMKHMKNYKPGPEARQAAKEMQENQIIQPINDGTEQRPTGKVMNDSEL